MYTYRNRSKAIRRQVPLNQGARDMLTRSDVGTTPARIGSAAALLRRVVEGSTSRRRRSHAGRREDHDVQTSATISAQRNPASSRAMAAATTERTFLWAEMVAQV